MPLFKQNDPPNALRSQALTLFNTHPDPTLRCQGDFTRGLSALIFALCRNALQQLTARHVTAILWLARFRRDLIDPNLGIQAPLYLAELAHSLSDPTYQLDNKEGLIKQSIYHYMTFMNQAVSNQAFVDPAVQKNIEKIIQERVTLLIQLLGTACPPDLQRPETREALQRLREWCISTTPSLAQSRHEQLLTPPAAPPGALTAVSLFKVPCMADLGPLGQTRYRLDPYIAPGFVYTH